MFCRQILILRNYYDPGIWNFRTIPNVHRPLNPDRRNIKTD